MKNLKKKYIVIGIVILFIIIIINSGESEKSVNLSDQDLTVTDSNVEQQEPTDTDSSSSSQGSIVARWVEHKDSPVIEYQDVIKNILWLDPSIIKDGDTYKMWLSGGDPFAKNIVVKTYYATSDDGVSWNINKKPVLEATPGAWDSESVETPSVVKVGNTYHLYYTGYNTNFLSAEYSIGHATSQDGINWVKDPNNPIIEPQPDPLKWGFFTTAEPAIAYHNGTFYLYYASAKSNYPEEGSPFGIMVATSKDGSSFKNNQIAFSLAPSYEANTYRGYSTPSVYVDNGVFHLYHGVVRDPEGFDQIAISSAESMDGLNFKEDEVNILMSDGGDWIDEAVWAPAVILDGDTVKMWFNGQTKTPEFDQGIGYIFKKITE